MFGNNSSGFSFGGNNNNTAKPASSGGMFGSNNTANKPTFGFGNNNSNNNTSGNKPTFGFGNSSNTNNSSSNGFSLGNNSTNSNTGGFSFGNKPTLGQSNTNKPTFGFGNNGTTSGGLFGNNNNNNNNNNNSNNGGLFGNKPSTTSGGLFGNKPAASGGLFGNKPAASGGLFGSNTQSSGFSFGNNNNSNNNNNNNTGLFGQNNQQQLQQQQQQMPQLTSMTKVSDLPAPMKQQLEELDGYIQTQVAISEYLKNNEADHKELIDSIPRDINYLEKKYVATNQALSSDFKFIDDFKSKTLESFNDWVEKLIKVYLQLTNPMSSPVGSRGQATASSKVVIGVNGVRNSVSGNQQTQKKQLLVDKNAPLNVSQILNSFYLSKIEDFNASIDKYQSVLKEVEDSINSLDKSSQNGLPIAVGSNHGLEMVVSTLQEEFKLYVELANEFAEIHHKVIRTTGGPDSF